jgi:hypothetical protein
MRTDERHTCGQSPSADENGREAHMWAQQPQIMQTCIDVPLLHKDDRSFFCPWLLFSSCC